MLLVSSLHLVVSLLLHKLLYQLILLSFLFHSGPQALMSGSNTMLGCSTGAIAPAGINLSGILPPGGLVPGTMPGTLPAAMQSASQAG